MDSMVNEEYRKKIVRNTVNSVNNQVVTTEKLNSFATSLVKESKVVSGNNSK